MAVVLMAPALAATDTTPPAAGNDPGAGSSPELSEVIIYARRRIESIQDTPLAVSARSGDELREQSADLLGDVGRDIPNVYMFSSPQSVNALNVTMRGQTVTRSAIMFDSAVGIYVDGVYVADTQGAMSTLLDVDSVEVVRGSQGTLFGRNNTGGAVLFYTHRPDLTTDSAELALSGGDFREFMGRAIINVPVSSTFGLRFAYQDNSRAGFGFSEGNGQSNLGNQHRYTGRMGALWKPVDGTEAYFTYEHFEANEHGAILHPLPGTLITQLVQLFAGLPVPGLPRILFPSSPFVADGGYPGFDQAKTDALQLTITQRLTEENTAKLILGYRRLNASTALDVDASPIPFADTLLFNTSTEKSAELQVSGDYPQLGFDWVGGLYGFQDNGGAPSLHQPASPQFLATLMQVDALTGLTGPNALTNDFPSTTDHNQNSVVNISEAAFIHSEGHITRDWALAAGMRYTHDKREIQESDYHVLPGIGPSCHLDLNGVPLAGPCPDINKVAGFSYSSWEVSTRYRLSNAWNTYARIGRSYRSGGWNTPLVSYNDQPFRPEQLTDYEIGAKANLLDGLLMLNADVFFGQYDDMQRLLGILDSDNNPNTIVINAGRARVSGTEFEGRWHVAPRLMVHSSFGWTDGHYQSFRYTPVQGRPPVNLALNSFSETPPYQASIGAQYEYPLPAGRLRLSTDYAWQARVQFNVINDFNYQPAYGTLNARVSLAGSKSDWEIALYATNVTDEHFAYNGGTITAPPSTQAIFAWNVPGAPRLVAVEALYRWSLAR